MTAVTVPIDGLRLPLFRDSGLPWGPHEYASVRLSKAASGFLLADGDGRYLEVRAELVADRRGSAPPVLFDVLITARTPEGAPADGPVVISIEATPRAPEKDARAPIRARLQGQLRN